jgi:putative phosphoesterase
MTIKVGIISDTHGLLRPEAVQALQGCELIIHAGDVGLRSVLEGLQEIAPVYAVRGNVDRVERSGELPLTRVLQVGEALLYVLHEREQLDLDPATAGFQAVISGHSHKPNMEWQEGVLYLNPGSAGPRRFKLPVTLAVIEVQGKALEAEIVELIGT